MAKSQYFNEDYRKFLNRELSLALNKIDFDLLREKTDPDTGLLCLDAEEETAFADQVAAARKYIEDVIYANDDYKGTGDVAVVGHSTWIWPTTGAESTLSTKTPAPCSSRCG